MATMNVRDAAGETVAIEKPLAPGRAAATASRPVALSTEDKAALDAITTALGTPATQATLAAILAKIIAAPATEAKQDATNTAIASTNTKLDSSITQETAVNTILGVAADAASTTTTIKAALRGIATALGITALDLGSGTGGTRTLRFFRDTAQWIGGSGAVTSAVQRVVLATDQSTFPVHPGASAATGGIASTSRIVSAAASTNATSAKGSAGRIYAIQGYNAASSVRYLKLYNKATAPTVGTDTPVKTLALPPGVGFAFDFTHGYSFATGIAYALTTGSADADTGALTAADVLGLNVDYV